jgi:hypothetical protein
MLNINQCLDKLAIMQSDFVACSMLPAGHNPRRNISLILGPHQARIYGADAEDNDGGPVEEENIDGYVTLAHTCGMLISFSEQPSLIVSRMQLSTGPEIPFNSHR